MRAGSGGGECAREAREWSCMISTAQRCPASFSPARWSAVSTTQPHGRAANASQQGSEASSRASGERVLGPLQTKCTSAAVCAARVHRAELEWRVARRLCSTAPFSLLPSRILLALSLGSSRSCDFHFCIMSYPPQPAFPNSAFPNAGFPEQQQQPQQWQQQDFYTPPQPQQPQQHQHQQAPYSHAPQHQQQQQQQQQQSWGSEAGARQRPGMAMDPNNGQVAFMPPAAAQIMANPMAGMAFDYGKASFAKNVRTRMHSAAIAARRSSRMSATQHHA